MKKILKISIFCLFALCVVTMLCGTFDLFQDSGTLTFLADYISPVGMIIAAGPGVIVSGGVSVGDITQTQGKEYLDEDLNKTIVKIRPSDTPLDTLTREINNVENVESFEAGGWEIGTRDVDDKITLETTEGVISTIKVGKVDMWMPTDVISVVGQKGADNKPLTLYVIGKGSDGESLSVKAVNGTDGKVPVITANTELLRLGTANSEKAAQTYCFNTNPSKRKNLCQIHMAQVEESIIHELQKKKVAMDFSVYKEQTIWEMKRNMELTNLFGTKGMVYNEKGEPVYFSDGVWNQMLYESTYNKSGITNEGYTALTREIFDGNNGSDRRLLMAGSGLLETLCIVPQYSKQLEAKNVEVVHGVRVHRIETSFGELLVKPMGSLFSGTRADWGMVLDMSYVVKKVFEPLQTQDLDLDKTGQRRVKAVRLLENYCLFLENLPVHRKIVPNA